MSGDVMPEWLSALLEWAVAALEVGGAVVILAGILFATVSYLRELSARREGSYRRYRANLGRGILLGLEFLVGADIIATVTAPLTLESVGALGLIVLIRSFLSFALETEIEGALPWHRRRLEGEGRR